MILNRSRKRGRGQNGEMVVPLSRLGNIWQVHQTLRLPSLRLFKLCPHYLSWWAEWPRRSHLEGAPQGIVSHREQPRPAQHILVMGKVLEEFLEAWFWGALVSTHAVGDDLG